MSHHQLLDQLNHQGVLPLFYHDDPAVCLSVVEALYRAGIRQIEFTNRGANALPNFEELVKQKQKQMPDLLLGVGTIAGIGDVHHFLNVGADFLVSPFFDSDINSVVLDRNAVWIPGCMTPAEIHQAARAGYTLIKLFPGSVLMPDFVAAIKPLFPQIHFVVTGGVEVDNLGAWLKAGVVAVGMGSKLITAGIIKGKLFDALQGNTQNILQQIATYKEADR
jgi:2-dehydro-3-deoxyphosphogluconate aldolase / (4S)-4-hydroxy-2-oxoglutarate aldolase